MATGFSYRERSLYASLAAELVVYVPYFFFHSQNSVNKVAGLIVTIIALQAALQAVITLATRNRTTDERDRLIELKGYRAGYLTIAILMVLGLGMLWVHAAFGDIHLQDSRVGLHFLSVFFSMLIIADIVKTAAQIVAYRRMV